MLRALDSDALLARPLSAVSDEAGVVGFLCEPRGPALAAIAREGAELSVVGPLGRGFEVSAAGTRPLLVGGGFGAALLARPAAALPGAVLLAGFRSDAHATAASLVPVAERHIVIEPERITALLALLVREATSVLAAGPAGLVRAAADAALQAGLPCQVALEAPMACGYGSCHGCAVVLDGRLVRLCLEGPVVDARRL
ncbi:MAG: dihydroorotate dehydrogenase electron transfer subunit [Gaiellales bacterium]|nr:dihydroorotate dehydrogenase electron transfer subunit [Gaiellales bacterium]